MVGGLVSICLGVGEKKKYIYIYIYTHTHTITIASNLDYNNLMTEIITSNKKV